jgi:hypothetical protein
LLYAIAMERVGKLTGEKGSTAVMVRGGKGRSVDVAAGAEEDYMYYGLHFLRFSYTPAKEKGGSENGFNYA